MQTTRQFGGKSFLKSRLLCVALATGLTVSAANAPTFAQDQSKYEVAGFRDARFGMTESEVKAVVTKSLGAKSSDITSAPNPVEGTTIMSVRLASLDPGPGPALVTYIFGYDTKRLIQVNVIWGNDQAKVPIDVNTMIGAGTRLAQYFAGHSWRKDTARSGIALGDNTVELFAAEDDKKGAVRLLIDGVKYQAQRDGKQVNSPDPKGPPKLIISYIANRENPDVAKIEKGKF